MLGAKYRELRKEQGVTLTKAAKNICSVSNLSRWENDKIELDFQIVIRLLNRINIDTNEFLNYANFIVEDHIPSDALEAINSKNLSSMPQLVSKYLNSYYQTKNVYHLYVAVILANQYQIINKQNLLSLKAQLHLYNYLSKITLWSLFNLSFLGNSVFLIDTSRVYAIGIQIINNFDFEENDWQISAFITALGTLSDATISLIQRNDLLHATKMLQALKQVSIPKYLDFFNLVFAFLEKIIQYVKDKNEQPILQFINSCLTLGMTTSAHIFMDVFKQIKNAS